MLILTSKTCLTPSMALNVPGVYYKMFKVNKDDLIKKNIYNQCL